MFAENDSLTFEAVSAILIGAFALICGLRVFSKKPEVTRWRRAGYASYWVIGPAFIAIGCYMLVTGKVPHLRQ
jgi:hypothetical protein